MCTTLHSPPRAGVWEHHYWAVGTRVCVCGYEAGTEVVLSVLLLINAAFCRPVCFGSVQMGERSLSSQWLNWTRRGGTRFFLTAGAQTPSNEISHRYYNNNNNKYKHTLDTFHLCLFLSIHFNKNDFRASTVAARAQSVLRPQVIQSNKCCTVNMFIKCSLQPKND